jgi:hypothetical protein
MSVNEARCDQLMRVRGDWEWIKFDLGENKMNERGRKKGFWDVIESCKMD